MLIRLDDHALVDDLCLHYRRSGFEAESVGGGMVEVRKPDAPTPQREREELILHLRVWEVANPNTHAEAL
jgi:hypothetical protein